MSATGSASGASFWTHLAVDSQGLAARGEHRDRRRGLDECVDGGRDTLGDLLAVVQQQEHRPFGGEVAQRVEGCPARAGVEAVVAAPRSATRSTEPGSASVTVDRSTNHTPSVNRSRASSAAATARPRVLPYSTGTDDRDDPAPRELGRDTAALVVPTDEPRASPGRCTSTALACRP